MLGMEEWMEVKRMKRQGHSIRHICRNTGYSRNTVRKMLRVHSPRVSCKFAVLWDHTKETQKSERNSFVLRS